MEPYSISCSKGVTPKKSVNQLFFGAKPHLCTQEHLVNAAISLCGGDKVALPLHGRSNRTRAQDPRQ